MFHAPGLNDLPTNHNHLIHVLANCSDRSELIKVLETEDPCGDYSDDAITAQGGTPHSLADLRGMLFRSLLDIVSGNADATRKVLVAFIGPGFHPATDPAEYNIPLPFWLTMADVSELLEVANIDEVCYDHFVEFGWLPG